jgi:hypothetical protein
MTILGMKQKSLFGDVEDPATIAMYSRKLGPKDLGLWLRNKCKIKPSSRLDQQLRL